MGEVHCRDPRTGIVYVYSSESYWDKEAKKKRERRKLIGKMDENGNMIPTNGKPGRPKKQKEESSAKAQDESSLQQEMQQMKESYERRLQVQAERIAELESRVRTMEREEKATVDALAKILTRKTAFLSAQQKA
jgi:hypothetical protein